MKDEIVRCAPCTGVNVSEIIFDEWTRIFLMRCIYTVHCVSSACAPVDPARTPSEGKSGQQRVLVSTRRHVEHQQLSTFYELGVTRVVVTLDDKQEPILPQDVGYLDNAG